MLRMTSHRLCVVVAVFTLPLQVFAQPFQPRQLPQGGPATPLATGGSQSHRILQQAQKLAADGDYAQALPTMQMLLDQNEDSLIFSANDGKLISFRQHVEITLGTFPADALKQYELVQGAKARDLFKQATAAGSLDTIVEVSRRFFHTQAGLDSTVWLAAYLFDHATPLAAGRMFDRARSHLKASPQQRLQLGLRMALCWHFAGKPLESRQLMTELVKQSPAGLVQVNGRRVKLPAADEDAAKWLAGLFKSQVMGFEQPQTEWHFAGGNTTRTATAIGSMPYLGAMWSQPLTEPLGDAYDAQKDLLSQKLERQINTLRLERLGAQTTAPTPASRPLVVNNTVVVRALGAVRAFDLLTGRHLWDSSEIDNQLAEAIDSVVSSDMTDVSFQKIGPLVDERVWLNANINGLSSDGETIYSLYGFARRSADRFGRVDPAVQNMLMAIELSTGRLKWELGGPPATEKVLNGHFMMGAPLPVQDALTGRSRKSLFALTETSGGIQAVAIDPNSPGGPRLVWSQTIHSPNVPLVMSRTRQTASLSPSYSEGILVCPTNAGSIVAIDLSTRRIMWSHSYTTRSVRPAVNRRIVIRNGRRVIESEEDGMLQNGAWQVSNAIIKSGRVFVTPRDSDRMLRLDLLTGTASVPISVRNGMFIAAVTDSHAVVVARDAIRGFHHSDATQNWTTPIDPPTGRGFQVGNNYILPVEGDEVIRLELATGGIERRAKSTDGIRPGNLLGVGDVVISHNGTSVSAYRTRNVMESLAKTLEQQPRNPDALIARGELAIADGDLKQGVADLKLAYQLKPSERSRQMLVRAFFSGLKTDFAEFVPHANGMKSTLRSDKENFTYHRHLAAGYAANKQPVKAFDGYMHLAEFASDVSVDEMLPQADSGHSVRMDRWLSRKLGQLYDTQVAEHRQDMDAALQAFVKRLAKSQDTAKLQRATRILGRLASIELHRTVAESIKPADDPIALELHLRAIEQRLAMDAKSDQESPNRLAVAERQSLGAFVAVQRVGLATQSQDLESARDSLNRLRTDFANVPVSNGRTGKQLAEMIDAQLAASRSTQHTWPTDEIEVVESDRDDDVYSTSIVRFDGPRGPVLRDRALMFMGMRAEFVALDGFGKPLWRFRGGHRDNLFSVSTLGNLLVIKSSNQVHALNLFGATKTGYPTVQWHIDFNPGNEINQFRRNDFFDEENRLALNSNTAFFLRKSELVAVDLLTGERVWNRKDVELIQGDQQQLLFADDEHLIVYQAKTGKQQVFRCIDGSKLKESEVTGRSWFTMVGTKALYPNSLRLVDQVSFETVWQGKFDPTSVTALVDDDHCAVLEPSGRFAVVNMHDGSIKLESEFGKLGSLKRLFVRRSEDRLIVIVDAGLRTPGSGGLDDDGEHGGMFGVVVYGHAIGVDQSNGKVIWRRQINGQVLTPQIAQDVPLLVFAGEVRAPSDGPRPTLASSLPILCIDTRDGQVLYRQVDDHRTDGRKPNTSRFQLAAGSKPNEVILDFSGKRIEFRFRKDAE